MKKILFLILLLFTFSAGAEDKIVELYATWCGPCNDLAPRIEKIARDLSIKLEKIDVDRNPKEASKFAIEGIPTLILIKDGVVVGRVLGSVSDEVLVSFIKKKFNK